MNNNVWSNNLTYSDIKWMYDRLSLIEYQLGYIRDNPDPDNPENHAMLFDMKLQLNRILHKLHYAMERIVK